MGYQLNQRRSRWCRWLVAAGALALVGAGCVPAETGSGARSTSSTTSSTTTGPAESPDLTDPTDPETAPSPTSGPPGDQAPSPVTAPAAPAGPAPQGPLAGPYPVVDVIDGTPSRWTWAARTPGCA